MDARRKMEADTRRAITNGEFRIFYQPVIPLRSTPSATVPGTTMEALVRWDHPEKGMLRPPRTSWEAAEAAGLLLEVEAKVLAQALRDASGWLSSGLGLSRVSLNVSRANLVSSDFCERIERALAHAGVAPEHLEVEIGEGLLMGRHVDHAAQAIRTLRGRGVSVVVDDFGRNHASLAQLRDFPVDRLKIDLRLIQSFLVEPADAAIVRAIIGLAHTLGIKITAKGVEQQDQLVALVSYGCDEAQGYLIGRPLPGEVAMTLERVTGWQARLAEGGFGSRS